MCWPGPASSLCLVLFTFRAVFRWNREVKRALAPRKELVGRPFRKLSRFADHSLGRTHSEPSMMINWSSWKLYYSSPHRKYPKANIWTGIVGAELFVGKRQSAISSICSRELNESGKSTNYNSTRAARMHSFTQRRQIIDRLHDISIGIRPNSDNWRVNKYQIRSNLLGCPFELNRVVKMTKVPTSLF